MDYQTFIEKLPSLYQDWGEPSVQPVSRGQFSPALALDNLSVLINFAITFREAEEIYCEIGTDNSATLIAALQHHPDCMAYAVNHFSNLANSEDLIDSITTQLADANLQEKVFLCDQSFEEFFFYLRDLQTDDNIGIYFYQNQSDYRSQLLGLLLSKPFLSRRALLILNNSQRRTVKQAILDFVATTPEGQILLELPAPAFGKGVCLVGWDRDKLHPLSWSSFNQMRQETVIQAISNLQHLEQQEKYLDTLHQEALSLQRQQEFAQAQEKYQELLAWRSYDAKIWLDLGKLYCESEQYSEAIEVLCKCLEIKPYHPPTHYQLGMVFEKVQQFQQAILAYQKVIELDWQNLEAYIRLGKILAKLGEFDQAETVTRQAIAVNPNYFGSYINLGNLLIEKNQISQAIDAYQTALYLNPDHPYILNKLEIAFEIQNNPAPYLRSAGDKLYHLGKYQQASEQYQQYLEQQSGDVELYVALSDCYRKLQQTTAFLQTAREGIRQYPTEGRLHFWLIQTLLQNGQNQEATQSAETASKYLPNDYTFKILKHLIVPIIYQIPEEIEYYKKRFAKGLKNLIQETSLETIEEQKNALTGIGCVTNFYLAYQAHNVREFQVQYGKLAHQIMAVNYPNWVQPIAMPPIHNGKIRIGYLSSYLHSYSGTLWLTGWLRHHDHTQFEIYCYYTGNDPDPITAQFQEYSDVFHHIPYNLEATCRQILEDQLHILIYPEIGMEPATFQIAALRLAPVKCVAWGHPVTTGLPTIDYFLSSQLMEPENAQDHYSETLIRLPNIGVAYPQPKDIPSHPTKTRADYDLPEDSIIYLCCQAPFKHLPQYDYILAEIAQKVPNAKFLFLRGEVLKPRLNRAFEKVELKYEDYCLFRKIPERIDYLNINLLSDVFLDTFTWSGGNTSLEAIACCLPLVTCPGEFMRGRHADSFLKMIHLTETIAQTEAEYIDIAVKLGLEPVWRNEIVEKLKKHHEELFDDRVCVQALEAFYQQIIQTHKLSNSLPEMY